MKYEVFNQYARGEITLDEASYYIQRDRIKRGGFLKTALCRLFGHTRLPCHIVGRQLVEMCACCGKERRRSLTGIEPNGAWT